MRSLGFGAQAERRRRVASLRRRGRTYAEIAEACELGVQGVFDICKRYQAEGHADLVNKIPGRREGEQRTLSSAQEVAIRKLICDKTPDQMKMPFALWNQAAGGQLVLAQLGIKLPVRSVGHYLTGMPTNSGRKGRALARSAIPWDCGSGQGRRCRNSLGR